MDAEWKPVLDRLVVPDLQEMERAARFDRSVLLWIQEEFARADMQADREDSGTELSAADVAKRAIAFHGREKGAGRGMDLCQYLAYARRYWLFLAEQRIASLKGCVERAEDVVGAGAVVDIKRVAIDVYIHLARLSGVIGELEKDRSRRGKDGARVMRSMEETIERLARVGKQDGKASVGQQVLHLVEQIGGRPTAFRSAQSKPGNRVVTCQPLGEQAPWELMGI